MDNNSLEKKAVLSVAGHVWLRRIVLNFLSVIVFLFFVLSPYFFYQEEWIYALKARALDFDVIIVSLIIYSQITSMVQDVLSTRGAIGIAGKSIAFKPTNWRYGGWIKGMSLSSPNQISLRHRFLLAYPLMLLLFVFFFSLQIFAD